MKDFVPYEKLSKKEKRNIDRMRCGDWGGLSPITRRAENPRAYQRRKAQDRREEIL